MRIQVFANIHINGECKKVKTPPPSFLMKTYGKCGNSLQQSPRINSYRSSPVTFASNSGLIDTKKISPVDEIIAAKRMQKLIDMNIA